MAYLMKISTRILGERSDFERESHFEGFIVSNPLILASSDDAPENLAPVYIIGRQVPMKTGKILDLICLIWDNDLQKYVIWIYELKVYSNDVRDVEQLKNYLKRVNQEGQNDNEIIKRAKEMVGDDLIAKERVDDNLIEESKIIIRGALCAQDFSDEVIKKIIEEKLVAVKINRFPVDNDVFVLVDPLIGVERSQTGGRKTYYDKIPNLPDNQLREELAEILSRRKRTHRQRFEQFKVLLEMLAKSPDSTVTQAKLRDEWENRGLPREDRGLSVSQFLGYKKSGALRQILTWDMFPPDIKDNYKLRDPKKYAVVIEGVLEDISKQDNSR